jgi:hypothetical protein
MWMARAPLALSLVAGIACSGGGADPDDRGPADLDGPPGIGPPDGGEPLSWPRPCHPLYHEDVFPTFEIEIAPSEWAKLQGEFRSALQREAAGLPIKPEHPLLAFRHDGEEVTTATIRLRGNHRLWEGNGDKMQFQISFNSQVEGGRFRGLRKIVLDSPYYDRSYLRDRVALAYLRDLGVPAPCANHARLVVNGEYYGLYASIEKINKDFLRRSFERYGGNLYKKGRELKTNESIGDTSRRDELWRTRDVAGIEALVDMDQALLMWASEAVIPQADGYWVGGWNFYLYDHPDRGFLFLPWDIDLAFDNLPATVDPVTHRKTTPNFSGRPHYEAVMKDPTWRARYVEKIAEALESYDPARLQARIDAWAAQIAEAAADDPHRPFTYEQHRAAVSRMRAYVADRADFLARWLARQ